MDYLCLTDLLDQDLTSYEYFQTLPPEVQSELKRRDSGIDSFKELQTRAAAMQAALWTLR